MHYLYRTNSKHKWLTSKNPPEGAENLQCESMEEAKELRKRMNAEIEADRATLRGPKRKPGRPWPEDHRKGKRVFFTLPAKVVDKIPGDGSSTTIKAFCKQAAIEKLENI